MALLAQELPTREYGPEVEVPAPHTSAVPRFLLRANLR
jgi:hypothetical protein